MAMALAGRKEQEECLFKARVHVNQPKLLDRLDKQTLLFPVVKLHDAGVRAVGFLVSAPLHPSETGLEEKLLYEVVREECAGVSAPDQVHNELGPKAHGFLVRDREVGAIPSQVSLDSPSLPLVRDSRDPAAEENR